MQPSPSAEVSNLPLPSVRLCIARCPVFVLDSQPVYSAFAPPPNGLQRSRLGLRSAARGFPEFVTRGGPVRLPPRWWRSSSVWSPASWPWREDAEAASSWNSGDGGSLPGRLFFGATPHE